jgi:flavin reductase (DIM6/NTAB) family NADH-FMN oxidoreductase RutF
LIENAHPLAESFRHSLRGLAASVTIISTQIHGVRYGMVATAVMSLSMEPPSLVLSVNRAASIHGPIKRRSAFVVNILSEWDTRVAHGFTSASGESRFAFGAWSARRSGPSDAAELPYLANAQATIFCRVMDAHAFGSHTLFIGAVQDVVLGREKAPLLYCDGAYGAFAAGA